MKQKRSGRTRCNECAQCKQAENLRADFIISAVIFAIFAAVVGSGLGWW